MSSNVLPVARSLILCEAVTSATAGKTHLFGVFDAIRASGFPHRGTRVIAYARLTGGLREVPAYIDVRHADRDEVVDRSGRFALRFPARLFLLQMAVTMTRCVFPYSGLYTVELFCHNQFLCDTTLRIIGPGGTNGTGRQ